MRACVRACVRVCVCVCVCIYVYLCLYDLYLCVSVSMSASEFSNVEQHNNNNNKTNNQQQPKRHDNQNENHLPHSTAYVGYIFHILPERDEMVPNTPVRVCTSSHHTVPRRSTEPVTVCRQLLQSNSPPANPGRAGQKYCLCYT